MLLLFMSLSFSEACYLLFDPQAERARWRGGTVLKGNASPCYHILFLPGVREGSIYCPIKFLPLQPWNHEFISSNKANPHSFAKGEYQTMSCPIWLK